MKTKNHVGRLTAEELQYLPAILKLFKNCTPESPELGRVLVYRFNLRHKKFKLNGARLRKYCHYIRSNSLAPIIATSRGYYVSRDKSDISGEIISLQSRQYSLGEAIRGLSKFVR